LTWIKESRGEKQIASLDHLMAGGNHRNHIARRVTWYSSRKAAMPLQANGYRSRLETNSPIRQSWSMIKLPLVVAAALVGGIRVLAKDYSLDTFATTQLTDKFWSEGATWGDFNHDGKPDVVAGPYWYEGPSFQIRHEYYPAAHSFEHKKSDGTVETIPGFEGGLGANNAYSDNFFAFSYDFNQDGWDDILIIGFPGEKSTWYENPQGKDGHWPAHVVLDVTDNESPTFTDITGDGKPEIVCCSHGAYGYAEPDWSHPAAPWRFHALSPNNQYQRFTHGLGVGDVNGDGRLDLMEKDGWWEQPKSLTGDPVWTFHKFAFGTGGAQMFAYDVNGDGRNDVITCLAAHGYGLAWFENVDDGRGGITFREHVFMNKEPKENKYGLAVSQLHALALADMDGDGVKDIVTGKRFWAHGPTGDVDPLSPAGLYWFQIVRHQDKTVDFVPHVIHRDSGVGTQVVVGDLNGDNLPDVIVGNKKGVFIHLHSRQTVGEAEWAKVQPKPLD
jgi:hypothetical protein